MKSMVKNKIDRYLDIEKKGEKMKINFYSSIFSDNLKNKKASFYPIKEEKKKWEEEEIIQKKESKKEFNTEKQDKTDTKIITKPDGTRVLYITVYTNGMPKTLSLKLSEPDKFSNQKEKETETDKEENKEDLKIEEIQVIQEEE